jgi:hypothetical protein
MGVADGLDWSRQFYQYANRLAHAYFLERVNGVPSKLVFVLLHRRCGHEGPGDAGRMAAGIDTVSAMNIFESR